MEAGARVSYKPYRKSSAAFFKLLKSFPGIKTVEKASIDEAYLDVAPRNERGFHAATPTFHHGEDVALALKSAIWEQLGLACSVGVAHNKLLAKFASRLCKPDGCMVVGDELSVQAVLNKSQGMCLKSLLEFVCRN